MKPVTLLFLCLALFVTLIQARPVVDTNTQQHDSSVPSSGKNTDFFFSWRPWFWRWHWFHPHPWPISPAPHGAPKIPKFPFPFPWAPGPKGSVKPKELDAASSDVESSSEGTKNPDFFFGWRRFWLWLWWLHSHHHSGPAPHAAPSKGGVELKAFSNIDDADLVDTEKCWSSLGKVDNCVDDIVHAFSSGNVEIGSACCSAIKKLGSNNCVEKTIGSFNNHRFTNAITDHCSSI